MAEERAPAGRIRRPIARHAQPRHVWVRIGSARHPGTEEATAMAGKARLCRWAEAGLGQYGWVWADYVEQRDTPTNGYD